MKFPILLSVAWAMTAVSAFQPSSSMMRRAASSSLSMGTEGLDLTGNAWKPDSEKMGSTDTGDYFPEGYDAEAAAAPAFSEGMYGSQGAGRGGQDGPELPGMENLGADAIMMGGIEVAEGIPAGMEFVASSVPDGEYSMQVPSSSETGVAMEIIVPPVCMTFEDYYASFTKDSHPSFSISPATGRMDRRGGEVTKMTILCEPKGQAGTFTGDLVINLPEDNSKICYKVTAMSF